MKNHSLAKERQNLERSMINAFGKELLTLKPEYQSMLIDDMVTAFFNRLEVLKECQ